MTKLEMLFVRACKSSSDKRVYSVYRRFYYVGHWVKQDELDARVSSVLLDICEKYCPVDIRELIGRLNPTGIWSKFLHKDSCMYHKVLLEYLAGHIATARVDCFPDMIRSVKHRGTV